MIAIHPFCIPLNGSMQPAARKHLPLRQIIIGVGTTGTEKKAVRFSVTQQDHFLCISLQGKI
jgi:hypothetical protein